MAEIKNKTIVVWYSCGAASAVAAKKTIEKYGKDNTITVATTAILEEDDDNNRFTLDVEEWIGQKVVHAVPEKYPRCSINEVFEDRRYLSGIHGAPCTGELKKQARYEFELKHKIDFHVLGFTADEKHRHERFIKGERANVIPVLIDEGLEKDNCFCILAKAGIELPAMYKAGFPNNNCKCCPKASSPTYWNAMRVYAPEEFTRRAEQSRRFGARLVRVKGVRIFLDELDPEAKGRPMKSWECGVFCDTE